MSGEVLSKFHQWVETSRNRMRSRSSRHWNTRARIGSGNRPLLDCDGGRASARLGRRVTVGERYAGDDGEAVAEEVDDLGTSGEGESSLSVGGLGVRWSPSGLVCMSAGGGAEGGARDDRRDFARVLSRSALKKGSGSIGSI